MQSLVALKVKIWLIVGLAALVAASARAIGLGVLSLGAVVAVVEFVLIHLLMRSWPLLSQLAWLPLPAWARVNLSGEWRGTIESQWRSDSGEPAPAAIPVTVDLHQGWDEVVFRMQTERMHSRTSGVVPLFDAATRELQFRYFFETEPTAASSITNPPQKLGTGVARVTLDEPDRMQITYTNERGTGGDIVLKRASPETRAARRRRNASTRSGPPAV
jgi:hypothetical protein